MEFTAAATRQVVLLHSNDIHSRLEQAARISSLITEERRSCGSERVLVLDIGDHMDRMRLETEGSDGLVNIELLNEAGYDAVTLGNNEGLTYGKQQLEEAYRRHARFPALCANLAAREQSELPEWLLPRLVLAKNGIRFGLIGVTAPFSEFYSLLGWEARDPFEAIRSEVGLLRRAVDVIVVLSHLGLASDERIAREIVGVDLILGGHTHHLLEEPLVIGSTTICAAGKFGEYLGRVEVELDPLTRRPSFRASCIPVAAAPEDPEAAHIIRSFRQRGERRLSMQVARLPIPLPASSDRETPLPNLLAAGLRRWTGAEIGLVNNGQLLGGLAEGAVSQGQLHALCPSPINPCRLLLRGAHIRQALEEALLPGFTGMAIRGFGFRGLVLGTLAVDGAHIRYDASAPEYAKLISVTVGGEPLQDERLYSVGTIDMFTFGIGYLSLRESEESAFYLPEFIRDVLAGELDDEAAVEASLLPRWQAAHRSL
ncbi:bifunctional metallophosphatase/5'-nucleotidase [Paenibacillus sp. 1P07SE]|uniref:bifunctional metallophosphatase/5'-nucleotidase n=1 Tax=Paenibacillus sp. 1P07SE TaxID=3132209 RepID=UPI0039A63E40